MVPDAARCPRCVPSPNIAARSATTSRSIAAVAGPPSSAWLFGFSSIGRAVARAFAAAGDRVAVHYVAAAGEADATRASLPGSGHLVVQADLADPEAVRRMVNGAAEGLGGLDVLVNNAGLYSDHRVAEVSYEEWQQVWRR